MTLDEAIKHCEEVAAEQCDNGCGKAHTQLAEWLKELKRLKEATVTEMWVARGIRGELNLFFHKPVLDTVWIDKVTYTDDIALYSGMFPEITFENSPQKIDSIVIRK
jgi:hypothetical protein